jgi:hypothetical protein
MLKTNATAQVMSADNGAGGMPCLLLMILLIKFQSRTPAAENKTVVNSALSINSALLQAFVATNASYVFTVHEHTFAFLCSLACLHPTSKINKNALQLWKNASANIVDQVVLHPVW